jgi:hypothetical protein
VVKNSIYQAARVLVLLSIGIWLFHFHLSLIATAVFPIAMIALFFTMPTNSSSYRRLRWFLGLTLTSAVVADVLIILSSMNVPQPAPNVVGSGDANIGSAIFLVFINSAAFLVSFIILTIVTILDFKTRTGSSRKPPVNPPSLH